MKRKRGRKQGKKSSSKSAASDASPPESSPSSPGTEEDNTPAESAPASNPPAPDPTPSLPAPEKPIAAAAPALPAAADIPYAKPKVGVVYGRVKLKFKSSKVLDSNHSSSEPQAHAGAGKSQVAAPEASKQVVAEKGTAAASSDGQTADGRVLELSGSDKDKGARKVGSIKIMATGLSSSVQDNTQDKKADAADEPLTSKHETALENEESENAESENALEPRNSQELEVKQSTLERQRDEKELAAALEAIKKVMKVDAAEPFNTPVDPVALGIPDYFDVIDTPMDFGTICQGLERGDKYMNSEDVYKDVQFIWDNCTKYNSKGDYIIELMKRVKKAFMKNWLAADLYCDVQEIVPVSSSKDSVPREQRRSFVAYFTINSFVPPVFVTLSSNDSSQGRKEDRHGGNDNTGDEDTKASSKSKSKQKKRRPGIDRHKPDCACAVCQVTRRKKERDEILSIDNETTVMNSDISDQHNMEANYGVNNPGNHDPTSSQEQPRQTDVDDIGIQMENPGKFLNNQPSSFPSPDYENEGSRQYSEEKEVKYLNSQDEHTPSEPNDDCEIVHHEGKANTATSQDEVEMEDYPIQQKNHSFLQLCARLFPSNQRSVFRGRHSLFRRQRQVSLKESPLHAAMAAMMKR